jgi:hypothetical protein
MVAFTLLVLATIAAFFVAQHLKVSTPLIAGSPRPFPAFISPGETGCAGANRSTKFSFYLLHRADDVAVYVVDRAGAIVRTLASGRHMRRGVRFPDGNFPWDGKQDNGRLAPDGTYFFRIALLHQGRTIELTKTPITVKTAPPRPVVNEVTPVLIPQGNTPARIRYSGVGKRGASVRLYRTDLPGGPRLVKTFGAPASGSTSWDGRIQKRPAPAGTYLVGLDATDAACNTGHFPASMPPPRGSTPHAGLTVRYLAAQPPLTPVPAGSPATVYVDSRHHPYTWTLTRTGARRKIASGTGRGFALRIRAPAQGPGVYVLSLRSGSYGTSVPLIVRAAARSPTPRVLVVLPVLTWQGDNPSDEDGDGVPDLLAHGDAVSLTRPFARGLPSDFADPAGILAFLDRAHLGYDLTTDLALAQRVGPSLSGHRGVVLAGAERWLPASLGASLRSYATSSGRIVNLGIDSLVRGITLRGQIALAPSAPAPTDAMGGRPGPLVSRQRQLLLVIRDGLGIFSSTSGAFPGYSAYQPLAGVVPPAGRIESAAGPTSSQLAIAGYRLGRGLVVRIGVAGFGATLSHRVDGQDLMRRLWSVLSH